MGFERSAVQRILLVKLRAIGDAVLTLPSLHGLHEGFLGAEITVLAPPAAAPVYQEDARCAEVLVYDRKALRNMGAHADFYAGLQARRFDLAVCLHASFRTALLGWMSGAPWRSVRNHSGPDWFCNLKAHELKEPKSIIQRDFDALRALGLSPQDEKPSMAIPPRAVAEAADLWRAWKLKGQVVLVFPGAGKPEKQWPLEGFLALAKALKRSGLQPLFLTAPGEAGLQAQATAVGAKWASVADLKVLGALAKRAGAAIGNDSGPRHIAAASGARTLTLFGPEALREWQPYKHSDGHWAVQAASGQVADLAAADVIRSAKEWLKK